MITHDRRRVVVASLFTLAALPALWVFNRESAATSGSPSVGAAGVDINSGGQAAPITNAYQPEPPLFVGGDEQPILPEAVNVAVPPPAGINQVLAKASFRRYTAGSRQGTTLLATPLLQRPLELGADIVLHTDVFGEIGDLADAPLPVHVSW